MLASGGLRAGAAQAGAGAETTAHTGMQWLSCAASGRLMHYNACMRTTIELSDPVYRRLKSVAIDRGMRGFSPIVEEALSEYFQSELHRSRLTEAIAAAEGAWSEEDVAEWEREREQAWATWSLPRS